MRPRFALALIVLGGFAAAVGCVPAPDGALSRERAPALRRGDRIPNVTERVATGGPERRVARGSSDFARLVRCDDAGIVYKDEEATGADRLMTPRLCERVRRLSKLVRKRWPALSLRVTEAWDEDREHGDTSLHYEGRAADITTSDVDAAKLGELAALAAASDFDWVYFENEAHAHVSVTK